MRVYPFLLLLAIMAGCQPPESNINHGNLTLGSVQTKITNGTTQKSEILQWFGAPNIVTRDKDGEVWNYTRQGTASELRTSSVGAWFLIGYGGTSTGFARSGSYSFDLLIRFNNADVVTDHKVLQTAF